MWLAPFALLRHMRERYGNRFTVRATMHPPLVFLSDPEQIWETITAEEHLLHPGEGARTLSPMVGQRSFMLSDADAHRLGRKTVAIAFRFHAVAQHAEMVCEVAERAVSSWPLDESIALHPRLRALTLEVLLRTIVGQFAGPLEGELCALHSRLLEMLTVTASPVFVEPRLRHGPGASLWKRFLRSRAEVDELLYALIERRRTLEGEPADLIAALAAQPGLDGGSAPVGEVRDNLMSIILAGHETTASQLAWAFQLLAHNPRACSRLEREIDHDAGEEYLTATVQEVLRDRCVFVSAIPRTVARAVQIGGWTYEPPVQLLACIYLLHHDARLYREPYLFCPERFLDTPPQPRAWLPWGGGRKRCPGLHLALLELKVVLRTVLAQVRVEGTSRRIERPRWRSVIVTPHAGCRVVLRRRKWVR